MWVLRGCLCEDTCSQQSVLIFVFLLPFISSTTVLARSVGEGVPIHRTPINNTYHLIFDSFRSCTRQVPSDDAVLRMIYHHHNKILFGNKRNNNGRRRQVILHYSTDIRICRFFSRPAAIKTPQYLPGMILGTTGITSSALCAGV